MTNLELFEKVKDTFALDRYNINIGKNVNDLESGTVNMGSHEIGKINTIGGIMSFPIASTTYRVMRVGDGFQILANNIIFSLTYTSLPDFMEINYFDEDNDKLTLTDQNDTLTIKFVSKVKDNDEYLKDKEYSADLQDRHITLVNNDKGISYRFFESYETKTPNGYSSGPSWDYEVDTFAREFHNMYGKGQKDFGSTFNGSVEDAKLLINENLKQNQCLEDINTIRTLNETRFLKELKLKIDRNLL